MKRAARVVELAGLAGAGKSTIAGTLRQYSHQVLLEEPPYFRRIRDIPFFGWNTFRLLPTLFHLSHNKKGSRWLTGQEIAWMAVLQGWHRRLDRPLWNNGQVIVLDQGPVFLLMMLHLHGPEAFRGPRAKEWWARTGKQWADTLDTVIWLDAATATLVERIRARDVWHGVQDKSTEDAVEYLGRYRESYGKVISLLTAHKDDLKVLAFDTARESLDSVVDKLLLEFGLKVAPDSPAKQMDGRFQASQG
jgi:cytidylate kinase